MDPGPRRASAVPDARWSAASRARAGWQRLLGDVTAESADPSGTGALFAVLDAPAGSVGPWGPADLDAFWALADTPGGADLSGTPALDRPPGPAPD